MADAKIKLELESKYNGKAFKEAGRSIDDIGKNVNKAGAALSQIGGQFGDLEGKAGKAAGAVGQFMGALTAGGPVAFVVAALGSIVGWIGKVRQEAEEANRKCREVAKEMGDSWKGIVAAGIVKARDAEIAFFSTAIEKGNAAIDRISKLGAAWNGVRDAARAANKAEADAAEAAIDVETARRVSNAASPEIGNMIQAEANAAKTYREGQRSVESAQKRIGDADTDISRLKGTIQQLQENLSVAQSAGKELARIEKQIQEKEERSASLVDVAQNTTSAGDAEALKAAQKQEIESLQ